MLNDGKNGRTIIDEAKEILPSYYSNGEWLDNPDIKFNGRDLDDGTVNFIKELLMVLVEGNVLNEITRIFLMSSSTSVVKAIETYNMTCAEIDKIPNINTAQSCIQYDKKRLKKYFPEKSTIYLVMAYPEKYLSSAMISLSKFERENMDDKKYRAATVLKIPKDYIKYSLDDTNWVKLVSLLDTYSTKRIEQINKVECSDINLEMIGYYNYLISAKRLKGADKARLDEINRILGVK